MASVNELIGRLMSRADPNKLFGTVGNLNPCAQLQDSYGPLTNKVVRHETAELAVFMLKSAHDQMQGDNLEMRQEAEAFLTAVNAVASELVMSPLNVTTSSVITAINMSTFTSIITDATREATARVSAGYTATQPAVTELLDMGVAIGAAQVPLAGPFLAGWVMNGASGALSIGLSSAVVYTTNAHPGMLFSPALPNESAALKMQQGVSKDVIKDMGKNFGPVAGLDKRIADQRKKNDKKDEILIAAPRTNFIGLGWYWLARIKLRWTNEQIAAAATGDMNLLLNSTSVGNVMSLVQRSSVNPQTRNQLCITSSNRFIDTNKFESAQLGLKDRIVSNYKTVEGFGKKLIEVQEKLHLLLADILKVNLIRCFSDDLTHYIDEYEKMVDFQATCPNFVIRRAEPPGPNTRHAAVVAALIVSYFYIRTNKVFGGYRVEKMPRAPSAIAKLAETSTAAQLFRHLQKGGGQSPLPNAKFPWDIVRQNSIQYVKVVKDAIVDDLGAPFRFGNNQTDDIKKAMKLFLACTMIVNDISGRKAAGENSMMVATKTKIPIDVIRLIEEAGFLKVYSTKSGTVSDKQKLAFTDNFTKLRWYDGVFKGASDSEKMMVFVFSTVALSVIDITKLACGFQSWAETKKLLTATITEINKAEKEMDTVLDDGLDLNAGLQQGMLQGGMMGMRPF